MLKGNGLEGTTRSPVVQYQNEVNPCGSGLFPDKHWLCPRVKFLQTLEVACSTVFNVPVQWTGCSVFILPYYFGASNEGFWILEVCENCVALDFCGISGWDTGLDDLWIHCSCGECSQNWTLEFIDLLGDGNESHSRYFVYKAMYRCKDPMENWNK